MLESVRRYRRSAAGLLVGLTVLFAAETASAQAASVPTSEAYNIAVSSLQSVATWGKNSASLIFSGAGGAAAITSVGGALMSAGPVGWAAGGLGVAVAGAVIIIHGSPSSGNTGDVLVTVGTQNIDSQPAPDLAGSTAPSTISTNTGVPWLTLSPMSGGALGFMSGPSSSWTTSDPSSALFVRVSNYVKAQYPAWPSTWAPYSLSIVAAGYAYPKDTGGLSTGQCPTWAVSGCVYMAYKTPSVTGAEAILAASLPPWAAAFWTYGYTAGKSPTWTGVGVAIPLANLGTTGYDCGSDSTYDYASGLCMATVPPGSPLASDGKCNVGWSQNGAPAYNKSDPDCKAVAASIAVNLGSASTAPKITVTDPLTGDALTVSRPAVASQGTVGNVNISESVPDTTSNTTTTNTTNLTGPVATPGQTVAPPATTGTGTQVAPGTGANAGSPAASVAVTNWPKDIEVTCTNCATDVTLPVDAPVTPPLPDATAPTQAQTQGFMDPVKTKLADFMNFQLPTHAPGTCPAMNFDLNAGPIHLSLHNNYLCDFLEAHRGAIQSAVSMMAVIGAIIIVLGA